MRLGALVGRRLALPPVAAAVAVVLVATVAMLLLVGRGGRDGGEGGDDDGLELHVCCCKSSLEGLLLFGVWKECMLLVGSEWMSW